MVSKCIVACCSLLTISQTIYIEYVMKTVESEQDVGTGLELASYMAAVVEQLKRDRKYPAAHGYLCALHSFQRFSGGRDVRLPVREVL